MVEDQLNRPREPGRIVLKDRDADLHHLDECDCSLLRPCPTGGARFQQRKVFFGASFDRPDETPGGGDTDGTCKKAELTLDDAA